MAFLNIFLFHKPELVDFLHYVETMDEKTAVVPENEHVRKIQE